MSFDVIDAVISPKGQLETLSQFEVKRILDTSEGELAQVFRNCSLAVLNCGSALDDGKELLERYPDFDIEVIQRQRGIILSLKNAPAIAFVDGKLIAGINEHMFAVLRDVIYAHNKILHSPRFNLSNSADVTNAVFHILRNAHSTIARLEPNMVVCWGGHSIGLEEYDYTKEVGYEMGLRSLDICTGCGPGAMKGADERRNHRTCQAAKRYGPLPGYYRAGYYRGRVAQSDRQCADHHAGYRKASGSICAYWAWHRCISWWSWHSRRDSLCFRYFIASKKCFGAISINLYRP